MLLALTLVACSPCDHEVLEEIPSPSRHLIAVIFETNCGATTDFTRAVAVRKTSDPFNAKDGLVVGGPGQPSLNAKWEDDSTLVVSLPRDFETRVKKDTVNGVTIRYTVVE